MHDLKLSSEQEAALDTAIEVIEAGPGAGKTRVLSARFLAAPCLNRKGIAYLSFTNAAVDELKSRLARSSHLLRSPNFVGTIDSFLHRFVVSPAVYKKFGHAASYFDSWDRLPDDLRTVRLKKCPGSGIGLSCFRIDHKKAIPLDNLNHNDRRYLESVKKAEQLDTLCEIAYKRMNMLINAGCLDSMQARRAAYTILDRLEGAEGARIIKLWSHRFCQLLVDEAHDCDEPELNLLKRIKVVIPTTVVADLDQAIYEFRGSNPQIFAAYCQETAESRKVKLTTNFRSSQNICKVVNSLRSAGNFTSNAEFPEQICAPIFVLAGSSKHHRQLFRTLLKEHEIQDEKAVVLAHSATHARRVAGVPRPLESRAAGNRVLSAVWTLNTSTLPSERFDAISSLERVILECIDFGNDLRQRDITNQLQYISRDRVWLRSCAAGLWSALVDIKDRSSFGQELRNFIRGSISNLIPLRTNLFSFLSKPRETYWTKITAQKTLGDDHLAFSTIHSAKGREYEAVLVVVPTRKEDAISDWEEDRQTEARRVLYVAASRAEKLLAFAVTKKDHRIISLLTNQNIPTKLLMDSI